MLATSTVTSSLDDLIVWPDGETSANWDELHVATTGDTYLDRDPITGVVYYDHLGDQDVSDIPF